MDGIADRLQLGERRSTDWIETYRPSAGKAIRRWSKPYWENEVVRTGTFPNSGFWANFFGTLAPRAGLEPATLRLTAECSTIELPRNMGTRPEQGSAGIHFIAHPENLRQCSPNRPWPFLGHWEFRTRGLYECRHPQRPDQHRGDPVLESTPPSLYATATRPRSGTRKTHPEPML